MLFSPCSPHLMQMLHLLQKSQIMVTGTQLLVINGPRVLILVSCPGTISLDNKILKLKLKGI